MKIAVYAICKDEGKHVYGFVKSCMDADYITVADTGSTDDTLRALTLAESLVKPHTRLQVHNISINPWRFDVARNVALALVPADADVCIRLDFDETLSPGWREAIEAAWVPGVNQLWYDFEHAPGYTFRANYIHARYGFIWKGWDHEGVYIATGCKGQGRYTDRLKITHRQDHNKPRNSILGRLQLAAQEDKSARIAYYLGREYFYYQNGPECIKTLTNYLTLPDAQWDVERMDVMTMIGESYYGMNDIGNAIRWYHHAIAEYATREPYLGLAAVLWSVNNKELAFGLVQHALRLTNKMQFMYMKPEAWNKTPWLLGARMARELGHNKLANQYEREAAKRDSVASSAM